jgi:hypothetical protein
MMPFLRAAGHVGDVAALHAPRPALASSPVPAFVAGGPPTPGLSKYVPSTPAVV